MARSICDVMTTNPISMPAASSVADAARAMRDSHIGDVIVLDHGRICGIVTDRDIVVRAVAEGRDFLTTTLGNICSQELTTLSPTDSVDDAVLLMRERALRRLPVVESGEPIGVVSLGDLAQALDPHSALGYISAAPPNR